MLKNIYVFRHGITYFSKNKIPYGDKVKTAEILPEGYESLKRIGWYLKDIPTDANFTSPFVRCIQSSNIVSEITGKKFSVDQYLRDWDPQSEKVEEMIDRINKFTDRLQTSEFSSVAICTHGYPINALIAYYTKGKIVKADLDNFPDPGVLIAIKDGKVSYKDFN